MGSGQALDLSMRETVMDDRSDHDGFSFSPRVAVAGHSVTKSSAPDSPVGLDIPPCSLSLPIAGGHRGFIEWAF